MTPAEWIALVALFVTILCVSVGGAVYIVRELGALRAATPAAVREHEHECANFEPNTAVQLQALRSRPDAAP